MNRHLSGEAIRGNPLGNEPRFSVSDVGRKLSRGVLYDRTPDIETDLARKKAMLASLVDEVKRLAGGIRNEEYVSPLQVLLVRDGLTIGEIAARCGSSFPDIRKDLALLGKLGICHKEKDTVDPLLATYHMAPEL